MPTDPPDYSVDPDEIDTPDGLEPEGEAVAEKGASARMPPDYPPSTPYQPSTMPRISPETKLVAIWAGAIILLTSIALLVTVMIDRHGLPGRTPTATSTPSPDYDSRWGERFDLQFSANNVLDFGLGDMMIFLSWHTSSTAVAGVNLATKEVVWTRTGDSFSEIAGDSNRLVVSSWDTNELWVIDPRTGETTTVIKTGRYTDLLWAGGDLILTRQGRTMCAREMSDPGWCAWAAPNVYLFVRWWEGPSANPYVFGDGQWVNTGDGVRELATGEPAGFGGDAKDGDGSTVYYMGSGSRVFRVQETTDYHFSLFQPWDVKKDKAISSAASARAVVADEASNVYLAYGAQVMLSPVDALAGFDWNTGDRLWGGDYIDVDYHDRGTSTYIDGKWVVCMNHSLVALDAATGETTWKSAQDSWFATSHDNLLSVSTAKALEVYDVANEFALVSSIAKPSCAVYVTEDYTFCYTSGLVRLWVLDS